MIRADLDIQLADIDTDVAQAAVRAYNSALAHRGDFFMPSRQIDGQHRQILVNGTAAGLLAYADHTASFLTIDPSVRRHRRQIAESVLTELAITDAFVASWDHHHLDLVGGFADEFANQAYQFELADPADLRDPVPGLTLTTATQADLPNLDGAGFLDDYTELLAAGQVRIARLDGENVGIGLAITEPRYGPTVDLGMFVNEGDRGLGIGRSIIALAARDVLTSGGTPTAGCWWRNHESRTTLEAAGLTCVGTIFTLKLDSNRYLVEPE